MKEIIFICFTPYQLLVSMYYAYKIKDVEKTLIFKDFADYHIESSFYEDYFDNSFIIPYYDKKNIFVKQFYKSYYGGYLFKFSPIFRHLKSVKNAIIMYFSDQEVSSNKMVRTLMKSGNNHIILTEEGISIYAYHETQKSLKSKIGNLLCGLHTCNVIGNSKYYEAIFAKRDDIVHPRFSNKNVIKQNNLFIDKEFIDTIDVCVDNIRDSGKKRLIILGEPINESDIIKESYIKSLKKIVAIYDSKYDIYIKPHPRENVEIYNCLPNCILVDSLKWVPVELIISKYEFNIVISICSSASINIAMLNDKIQILLTYKLYGLRLNDNLLKLFNQYSNIKILNSYDDFNNFDINKNAECKSTNTDSDLEYIENLI